LLTGQVTVFICASSLTEPDSGKPSWSKNVPTKKAGFPDFPIRGQIAATA
jgi:hypothetical protein